MINKKGQARLPQGKYEKQGRVAPAVDGRGYAPTALIAEAERIVCEVIVPHRFGWRSPAAWFLLGACTALCVCIPLLLLL